ncbi:MAG TPA: M23 family peptidase [Anaerolinea thermolimosa]|uniref:M23 family peptidase n=1 Tax=Anaerolinea thermolimosa TaxID=229919 RepID=A0A3D1JCV6_9CHLR|nr:M23 family metallopeptidase [Anaerolinea thermolimosa]GAP07929.1 membrane proteins related to metalloendopeptidases [Anaerolinea thermolimosa]HCE16254.1 M23 family peptidase [Anaerolinea thermolimosa]
MIDSYNPLSVQKVLTGLSASSSTAPQRNSADPSFQQLLSMAMLGGGLSSEESNNGVGSLMLPLMLLLLEKILSLQATQEGTEEDKSGTPEVSNQVDTTRPDESPRGDPGVPSGRPVGGVLTQGYHAHHYGLDFGIPVGTAVKSTMDGKVVYAGWNNQGYGNLVIVENGPYRTYYAHLSEIPVRMGEHVSRGDVVGLSGNTGNSTGPHLHYEIRYEMKPLDPTGQTLR